MSAWFALYSFKNYIQGRERWTGTGAITRRTLLNCANARAGNGPVQCNPLTRALGRSVGTASTWVNSVLPGPVETDGALSLSNWDEFSARLVQQTPLGRIGKPADIAKVVSFLASDDAGWITGQVIPVAGGLRA